MLINKTSFIEQDLKNWEQLQDISVGQKIEVDLNDLGDSARVSWGSNNTYLGLFTQSIVRTFNKNFYNTISEIEPTFNWFNKFRKNTIVHLKQSTNSEKKDELKDKLIELMEKTCKSLDNLQITYANRTTKDGTAIKDLIAAEQKNIQETKKNLSLGFIIDESLLNELQTLKENGVLTEDKDKEIIQKLIENPAITEGAPILWAIREGGSSHLLGQLNLIGADPDCCGKDGMTPLLQAVKNKNKDLITYLIEDLKADPNKDHQKIGFSPLEIALGFDQANEGTSSFTEEEIDFDLIKLLHKSGADVNRVSKNGCPLLLYASTKLKSYKLVELLLDLGANPLIKIPNPERENTYPWLFEVLRNIIPLFNKALLLQELEKADNLLILSSRSSSIEIFKLILSKIEKIEKTEDLLDKILSFIHLKELDSSMQPGYFKELIELLAEEGFNIEEKKEKILIIAIIQNNIPATEFIIKQYFSGNANYPISSGSNSTLPLALALESGYTELADKLIELGASSELAKEILDIKLFGHAMGLKGIHAVENIEVNLEGTREGLRKIAPYIEEALSKHTFSFLSLENINLIKETYRFAAQNHSNSEIAERIQSGQPTIIQEGFNGHAITYIFYNDEFMICNKGATARWLNGTEIYSLKNSEVNEKFIAKLKSNNYYNDKHLYRYLDSLQLPYKRTLVQSSQKVGNCSWSSAKSSLYALLCAITKEPVISNSQSISYAPQCKNIFRAYKKYIRQKIFVECKLKWEKQNKHEALLNAGSYKFWNDNQKITR